MNYKFESDEYIRGITKIEFVKGKTCSEQKEIGKVYVSEVDRTGQGILTKSIPDATYVKMGR